MVVAWLLILYLVPNTAPAQVRQRVQVQVRSQSLVRVPARPAAQLRWREKRGPKCITAGTIGAAAVVKADSVDLILRGGERVRAQLRERCPALDFYSGFYLRASADGRICADRDYVHARSGGQCQITRFRKLVADTR